MDFRTVVPVKPLKFTLSHSDRLLIMGSCFAENMGVRLKEGGFKTTINPFGVLFNPASVGTSLHRLRLNDPFLPEELVEQDGWYHSFSHHGSFSGTQLEETLASINTEFAEAATQLREATCLILTFGTAWVYALPSTDQIVANCHKFPDDWFVRRRLSVDEIVLYYENLLEALLLENPNLKVLLTVSPIRHWKDGAHENTLSKSVLHLAVEELCSEFEQVEYFPAYELLMDDLRDYRFYAEDMLHPSEAAQQYVWEQFMNACFSKKTRDVVQQVQQLRKAMKHRPFHPDSEVYSRFAKKNVATIELLQANTPELDLSDEKRYFEDIL